MSQLGVNLFLRPSGMSKNETMWILVKCDHLDEGRFLGRVSYRINVLCPWLFERNAPLVF